MEQESIFVGIDVAKAQVDVAVRPTDDRWEVSHDDAGIGQLVSQLKSLEPVMVLVEASAAWNCPLWQLWRPRSCRWWSSTQDRCATEAGPLVSWPRPMPWMQRSWPILPKRSDLRCALCETPRRRFSTRW